jgi:hypothetical protein
MKKRVLNLSLLMLLSTSFNAFGMINAIRDIVSQTSTSTDKVVEDVKNKINTAVIDLTHDGTSEAAKIKINDTIEAIRKLPDSKFNQISEDVKSSFAKSLKVFSDQLSLLNKVAANSLKEILDKSANINKFMIEFAQKNPKTAGAIALVGAAGTFYGVHNLLKSKGIIHDAKKHTRGGAAAIDASALVEHHGLSPELQATVDAEIQARGGDVNALVGEGNKARTLLMEYSEGPNASLDKVKYLVENKSADLNLRDNWDGGHTRSALEYASIYGHADIVDYLLSKLGKIDTSLARQYAEWYRSLGNFDEENYKKIILSLDNMNSKK